MNKLSLVLAVSSLGFSTLLAGCGSTGVAVSKSHTPGMTKLSYEIGIDAPRNKV